MRRLINKRLVVIETPYAAPTPEGIEANLAYLRACLADSLRRNEAPFASHAQYTQPGVLDDNAPDERELGMLAGFAWGDMADVRVCYVDKGVSPGMARAINRSKQLGQPVEYRTLGGGDGST